MFIKTKISLIVLFLVTVTFSEVIKEEFNSTAELNSFWNVSTWGISTLQYSADNVWIDETNGELVLKLNASPSGTKPVCGEVQSKRNDFLYGSYRASIKLCNVSGSVIGWFVYKDGVPPDGNLHEVDVEYLTENLNQIHFTLHHDEYSVEHQIKQISFDPTADFHEYRFDWYPDSVVYYIDSSRITSLTTKVPDAACTVMLNHWSKNITNWGGPAPTEDTYMYINYMHYYSLDETSAKSIGTTKSNLINQIMVTKNGDIIDINFSKNNSKSKNIGIYNISGKKVFERSGITGSSLKWDSSNFSKGVYYIKSNASVVKFIK